MQITVTIRYGNVDRDFRFENEQSIKNLLEILNESGILPLRPGRPEVKSVRRMEYLDIEKTFLEEKIFSGDILEVHG